MEKLPPAISGRQLLTTLSEGKFRIPEKEWSEVMHEGEETIVARDKISQCNVMRYFLGDYNVIDPIYGVRRNGKISVAGGSDLAKDYPLQFTRIVMINGKPRAIKISNVPTHNFFYLTIVALLDKVRHHLFINTYEESEKRK